MHAAVEPHRPVNAARSEANIGGGLPGEVSAGAAFSSDGNVLATGKSGGEVLLSDPATGKQLSVLIPQRASGSATRVTRMAFAPYGSMIAVAESTITHLG